MIANEPRYEKASDEMLAKQGKIVSLMERYIDSPYAVAATQAVDAVTGDPIDAMGVYEIGGFCWSTEDFFNFKRHGFVNYGSERAKAAFEHFLELVSK